MAVTVADVKRVYGQTSRSDADIQAFINTAALIVSEQLTSSSLSLARKDQITIYLAAHYMVISDEGGGIKSKKIGDSAETYAVPDKTLGYGSTRFGQQALMLDTTDTLYQVGLKGSMLPAEFEVV